MNREQLIAAFVALHDPMAQQAPMVYEVWEDGEVTLTKGGELYGSRSLHSMWIAEYNFAEPIEPLPVDRMPKQNSRHGCIQVEAGVVNKALELLFGKCGHREHWYR